MSMSIVYSTFYAIAWLSIVSGLYFYKKSSQSMAGIIWIPMVIIASMCIQTFTAGILNIVMIPVNLISIAVCEIVMGGFLWYRIIHNKKRQQYTYNKLDFAFVVLLMAAVIIVAVRRYGLHVYINFDTIDPAAHLQDAMNVVNTHKVSGMFYSAINNALLIQLLSPLIAVSRYYKIFVLSEILMLFLSGLAFYAAIRNFVKSTFLYIVGIVITFIYVFGYPLNNMIFGFVYLGMGVTLVAYLIVVTNGYLNEELDKWPAVLLISLGCLGLFESYLLFVPAVFIGIFLIIAVQRKSQKKLFTVHTVIEYLSIFLIPCLFGLYYSYLGIFTGDVTPTSAIANEGHIYRDLYSNFILIAPMAITGFWVMLKTKTRNLALYITPVFAIFMGYLLYQGMHGLVSSYYYYKTYYLLWLLVFILVFAGISSLAEKSKPIIIAFGLTWIVLLALLVFKVEENIQSKYPLFSPVIKSSMLTDVYSYNEQKMLVPTYPIPKLALYDYVYSKLLKQGTLIPLAGYWEDDYWYQAITNQRLTGFNYWVIGEDIYFENLKNQAKYVLVLTDSEIYSNHRAYFDSLEKIYWTEAGFIGKLAV